MSGVAEGTDPMEEQAAEVESQDANPTGCLTRIIPVTTPGCAAALTLVFLITTVVSVWIVFWLDPVNIPWRHGYSWLRIFTILGLIVLIPWVVFRTIQAWLEGPRRAFPELDMAWQAGINALAANELTPKNAPLFLIVGSNGEAQERAMMAATGMSFSVQGVPHGPAPIHWYANAEAIYLFCSDSSWTSALASLREELSKEQSTIATDSPIEMSEPISIPSLPTSTPSGSAPSGSAPAPRFRGTLEFDSFGAPSSQPLAPAPAAPAPNALPSGVSPSQDPQVPAAPTNYRGTLILNGAGSDTGNAAPSQPEMQPFRETAPVDRGTVSIAYSAGVEPSDAQGTRKPVLVSHQYSTACLQELAYLGSLVRKSRQPLCSINGVLTLLQMEAIHGSPVEVEELTKAIRSDLETVQYAFQIRCPVTALIVGLEKERGFRELVRRVGRDRALSQRFGKRFDVQSIPTRTELVSLATLACSAFEDWTYSLFREEQALTKPGNTRLYELLSKVRCNWKSRLSTILSQGFGCEENTRPDGDAILFSGCYFAGTGETADRQAFVKGIVEKLNEEQEFIEWAPSALRSHRLQSALATIGIFVVLGLLLLLLGMFVAFNTGLL